MTQEILVLAMGSRILCSYPPQHARPPSLLIARMQTPAVPFAVAAVALRLVGSSLPWPPSIQPFTWKLPPMKIFIQVLLFSTLFWVL